MLFFKKIKNILITGPLACAIIVSCMAFFVFEGVYAESFFRKKLVWVKEKIIFTDTFDKTVTEKNTVQTVTEAKEEKPSPEELVIKPVDDPENMKLIFPKDENMYTTVTKDYFDDALFIGDSRTISLEIYGDWKNATYYTKQGISVWEILEEDVAKLDDGTTTTLEVALKQKEFKKIFIMLGVNELATGTSESFLEQYKKVVDTVRELQPEAVIFIQSIIHVSKEKSDAEEFIKNPTINERNIKLFSLVDNEKIFFLDANEVLDDEMGTLTKEYTFDGVHLTADYLYIYKEYLLNHGLKILLPEEITEQ